MPFIIYTWKLITIFSIAISVFYVTYTSAGDLCEQFNKDQKGNIVFFDNQEYRENMNFLIKCREYSNIIFLDEFIRDKLASANTINYHIVSSTNHNVYFEVLFLVKDTPDIQRLTEHQEDILKFSFIKIPTDLQSEISIESNIVTAHSVTASEWLALINVAHIVGFRTFVITFESERSELIYY